MGIYAHDITVVYGSDYTETIDLPQTTQDLSDSVLYGQVDNADSLTAVNFPASIIDINNKIISISIPASLITYFGTGKYSYSIIAKSGSQYYVVVSGTLTIPPSTVATNEFTFFNSSSVAVTHNLNKYPSVTVTDSALTTVIGDVDYIDLNNLSVTFSAPFSGNIILN